eukprot:tig00021167_g19063.t1
MLRLQTGVSRVGLSGSRRFLSVSLAVYGRMFALAGLPEWDTDGTLEAHARKNLVSYINTLETNHLQLQEARSSGPVTLFRLQREKVPAHSAVHIPNQHTLWDAVFETIDAGRGILHWPSPAAFREEFPDPETNDDFFVLSKDVDEIYEALVQDADAESDQASKSFTAIR